MCNGIIMVLKIRIAGVIKKIIGIQAKKKKKTEQGLNKAGFIFSR